MVRAGDWLEKAGLVGPPHRHHKLANASVLSVQYCEESGVTRAWVQRPERIFLLCNNLLCSQGALKSNSFSSQAGELQLLCLNSFALIADLAIAYL